MEVEMINANPAQHPPTPDPTPSPVSLASNSSYTHYPLSQLSSPRSRGGLSSRSSLNSSARGPSYPTPPFTGSAPSFRSPLNSRQERLDRKRNDYFAARALSAQNKEIKKLEREIAKKQRQEKRQRDLEEKREKKRQQACRPGVPFTDKADLEAIQMIDWLRNYAANKKKGTVDTFSEIFSGFDKDLNGGLDSSEFKERLRMLGGYERASSAMLERAFKIVDTNNDKELSANELRYAVVCGAMGDKIDKYKRKMYNEGRLRERLNKVSHIRKVRGKTSMLTAEEKKLLSPVAIKTKWIHKKHSQKERDNALLPSLPGCVVIGGKKKTKNATPISSGSPYIPKPPSASYSMASTGSTRSTQSSRSCNPIFNSVTPF